MVSKRTYPIEINVERIVDETPDGLYYRDAYKIQIHGFLYRAGGSPDIVCQIYRRKRMVRFADRGNPNKEWVLSDVALRIGQIPAFAAALGAAFAAFRDVAIVEWDLDIDPDGRIPPASG